MLDLTKLKAAIQNYLTEESSRKLAAAKGRITRLVNELASEHGAAKVRTIAYTLIPSDGNRTSELKRRFTPNSFYKEGDRVFGWWDREAQAQAEVLPLYDYGGKHGYLVSFCRFLDSERPLWRQRGFYPPEDLPVYRSLHCLEVSFPVEKLLHFLEHGYALPCPLQWWWDDEGFQVTRSIVDAGYLEAYKWWAGCQWWYYEKHPEWFSDSPIWGGWEETPIYYYAPEPDSAVLGGVSRK